MKRSEVTFGDGVKNSRGDTEYLYCVDSYYSSTLLFVKRGNGPGTYSAV